MAIPVLRSFAAFGSDFHDLSRLTDMGASLTSADESALQQVLEELSVPARCLPCAFYCGRTRGEK
jgi:hypothetical protein